MQTCSLTVRYNTFVEKQRLYIVMELCEGGDLHRMVKERRAGTYGQRTRANAGPRASVCGRVVTRTFSMTHASHAVSGQAGSPSAFCTHSPT